VPIADLAAGLYATIGVLAALHRARETGRGEKVEVALSEACASLFTNQAMNYLIGGIEPRALGNTHPSVAPYQVIQARDRALALAASSDVQFRRLCAIVGLTDLPDDDRFADNASRVAHRDELEGLLEARLAQRPAADWVRDLNQGGVPAAVINSVGEMFEDPDTKGFLTEEVETGAGAVRLVRTPIRLAGEPLPLSSPPPRLGEHSEEIRAAMTTVNGAPR
jgi:crotonobetainyl-CoA:carnitine CoA-transferase CaiB-like acyl-CoA transferase